mmetsp:Transcript_97791/g.276788  ORF Transcript_97791/g.276788 Transcript_97791/m.276788 type:complete len:263 (+) Transcript_97791:334-1122(+)
MPSAASVRAAAARTWPQRSLKHLSSFSICTNTPSPMTASALTALSRIWGCWHFRSLAVASMVEGLAMTSALAISLTARTAAETTCTSGSAKSLRTSSSNLAPSTPMWPSASAALRRTSGSSSVRTPATFSAYFFPSLPMLASVSAAAHLAMRRDAFGVLQIIAAENMVECLSTYESPRSPAIRSAWAAAAFDPMEPRTTAAAHLPPPLLPVRRSATSPDDCIASVPRASKIETAVMRTITSSSARHLQTWPRCPLAAPICWM